MEIKEYIQHWASTYKKDLTENIMPFWMKHGWDRENGGVYTCVNRDGSLMDSTKSVWFQGRFAFVCSFAYNNIEHNLVVADIETAGRFKDIGIGAVGGYYEGNSQSKYMNKIYAYKHMR